jgi:hypothetical protein
VYVDCDCGCLIQKCQLSRHIKTVKHSDLLKAKNEIKESKKNCDSCNVELTESYRKCECRLCEDWGGCKEINGYYYLMCPTCNKDFGTVKTDYWKSDFKHGIY